MSQLTAIQQGTMKSLERNSNGKTESAHDCTDANIDQKKKMSKKN